MICLDRFRFVHTQLCTHRLRTLIVLGWVKLFLFQLTPARTPKTDFNRITVNLLVDCGLVSLIFFLWIKVLILLIFPEPKSLPGSIFFKFTSLIVILTC